MGRPDLFQVDVAKRKRKCHGCGTLIEPGQACMVAVFGNKINLCNDCLHVLSAQVDAHNLGGLSPHSQG